MAEKEANIKNSNGKNWFERYKPIGFIGFGNMGQAIAKGLIRSGYFQKGDFVVAVGSQPSADRLKSEGWKVLSAREVVKNTNIVFIAVKPKDGEKVLKSLAVDLKGKVLISVMAGIPLEKLNEWSPHSYNVRTMPNVNVEVGKGIWGVTFDEKTDETLRGNILEILNLTGLALEIPERLMNAITALAGSGPAFVAEILDAFAQAGVKLGFKYSEALKLALYTFGGTIDLISEKNLHPVAMRDKVTSPAGTTIYGLAVMNEEGLKGKLVKVIETAKLRADELS
jgi:pyrroline-5-carboxylate reductase